MVNLPEPYIIRYPQIVAVADSAGERVELIEFFDCTGGAMWAQHHYAQSPLVSSAGMSARQCGTCCARGNQTLPLRGPIFLPE